MNAPPVLVHDDPLPALICLVLGLIHVIRIVRHGLGFLIETIAAIKAARS